MAESQIKAVVPAIGVSLNTPVGEGPKSIGLVFQTHLAGDLPDDEVNAKLDQFMEYARRQQVIGKIPDLEKAVKQHKDNIRFVEEDIERLDKQAQDKWEKSGKVGKAKLQAQDNSARENGLVNLKRFMEMLSVLEAELTEAKGLLKIEKKKGPAKAA